MKGTTMNERNTPGYVDRMIAKRNEGGFTLIELLIVVIILGILAAIVVFSVTGLNNTASASSCQTTVKTIDTAAEAYYAQKNAGALHLADLVTSNFLHADSTFTATVGDSVPVGAYTVIWTAGTTAQPAGGADATVCK